MSFENETVVGAPYSAEAVTEMVQTLSDGNRIVQESKAQVSRDSKGRTRREQSFRPFGPVAGVAGGAEELRHVQISDPDVENHDHARPTEPHRQENACSAVHDGRQRSEQRHRQPIRDGVASAATTAAGTATILRVRVRLGCIGEESKWLHLPSMMVAGPAMKPVVEQLGNQIMEGVTVEGTRTTMTIPAGQIGNESPIQMVSERWFSPELKVLVMSRQSDPRFGETTYRLIGLTRVEPPEDLFEIPSDYKVIDFSKEMISRPAPR